MIRFKDGVITGVLMRSDVGAMVEIMQEIATSLKAEEEEKLRQDRFMVTFDDLVKRIWRDTDAYAEVANVVWK